MSRRLHAIRGGAIWGNQPPSVGEAVDGDTRAWVKDAACANTDPEMFFYAESADDRHFLKHLCQDCPVRLPCLEDAITNKEFGWWGGMSTRERAALVRRRRREARHRDQT